MSVSELRKKAVFFVFVAGTVSLLLIIVPFVETFIREYAAEHFDLVVKPDGTYTGVDGREASGMSKVSFSLVLNLFRIATIILWMTLIISLVRFVNYLVFGTALRKTNQYEISTLLKSVFSIIIYILAFFIVFQSQYPDVPLAPLFTGSTILGIVVGLALQDTLGNLFAGIALQADQPFQVGDVINIQDRWMGVVENVSWRGVKIRTFQNRVVLISNASLGKEAIEVAPRENLNARIVFFNTIYSASPTKTIQLIRDVVQKVENVSSKIRPIVRVRALGDNGIEYEVKYWIEDYAKFNDTDALVRQRIWYAFQREGIHFAFPTRTLYVEKQPLEPDFAESISTIFERLTELPLFAPLTKEETLEIAKAVEAKIFPPDEPIVKRGQEGNSMFIIHRGAVKVQVRENGKPKIIRQLKEGEFFGEMGLFTGEPRTATVVATEETEVLEIKHTCLKPILQNNPELVERFSEIIEERRAGLAEVSQIQTDADPTDTSGVFQSIRRFFGLKG